MRIEIVFHLNLLEGRCSLTASTTTLGGALTTLVMVMVIRILVDEIIPHICHFIYPGRVFEFQMFHTKTTKTPKNIRNKVKYFLHFTFYTCNLVYGSCNLGLMKIVKRWRFLSS